MALSVKVVGFKFNCSEPPNKFYIKVYGYKLVGTSKDARF